MTVNNTTLVSSVLILGFLYFIKFSHGEDSTFTYNKPKPKICEEQLTKFATWTKQFLNCAIHDSEPVRYCRNCGNLFSNVTVAYNTLDANETCKAIYFNQDRLNVLQTIYSSSLSLWEAGSCANCFDWVEPSDYSTQNISSRTQEFFDDLKNVTMCINTFRKNTCEDCAEDYNKVNALYNSIKESTKDVICFDIKDAMNKTRLQWSRDLKCCKDRKSSLTAFIVTSIILSGLIPFTFYTGFMFFGWRREQQHDFLMDSDHQPSGSSQIVEPITLPTTANLLNLNS